MPKYKAIYYLTPLVSALLGSGLALFLFSVITPESKANLLLGADAASDTVFFGAIIFVLYINVRVLGYKLPAMMIASGIISIWAIMVLSYRFFNLHNPYMEYIEGGLIYSIALVAAVLIGLLIDFFLAKRMTANTNTAIAAQI